MQKGNFDLIVSYNYSYIVAKDVLQRYGSHIINMHISFLPFNRGASPNIWSFVDNTPKGVTIQQMSAELDKGAIIYQKRLYFREDLETLESSYRKLHQEIIKLFKENFDDLVSGNYPITAQEGIGSYHTKEETRKLQQKIGFSYSDTIACFRGKIESYRYSG